MTPCPICDQAAATDEEGCCVHCGTFRDEEYHPVSSAKQKLTASIHKDPEWDGVALVERRRWRIDLSNGGRKYTNSRREAVDWCEEMDIQLTLSKRTLIAHIREAHGGHLPADVRWNVKELTAWHTNQHDSQTS